MSKAPFVPTFNYSQFESQDLAYKANETLNEFKSFVRQTFDGIIEIGRKLQEIQDSCLVSCKNGKKVFKQWLDSKQFFGASTYIAKAAIQLYNWFKDLDPRLQRLIRENVQNWKVSALRHLKYLTDDLLEVVVTSGKKTAAQVKQLSGKVYQNTVPVHITSSQNQDSVQISNTSEELVPTILEGETRGKREGENTFATSHPLSHSPTQLKAPGVRIVVKNENTGWNGYCGIITDVANNDEFWVLLDHTIAQGMQVKHLLKSNQLQVEGIKIFTPKASETNTLTEKEIEQIRAEAIRQYKSEKAEEEQGRFVEIRNAALEAAKKEIIAAEKHAQNMTQKYHALIEQLEAKEKEIARLHSLHFENQQLQQRVTELENALVKASQNNWDNTFNAQATKALNSELEKKLPQLMSKVKLLENSIKEKDAQLAQMKQQVSPFDNDSVILSFGEIGEQLGWDGWRRSGYRDSNGTLHKGISAISAFVSDLTRSFQQETAF
ncbi:hypothetical protein CAL7716_080180 [Calothrix sp. PCC 7716]|nr:hypothetical protein CAL7716_080180 [Calothrix sp. PCC 7716]